MSLAANNNNGNGPVFNGAGPQSAPSWGQAGCGSVGYCYPAIIASMNALQTLVSLNSEQAQYQAEISSTLAQANAKATQAAADEQAEATKCQAYASIASGAASVGCAISTFAMSYAPQTKANEALSQQNNFETMQTALANPSETPGAGDSIEMTDLSNRPELNDAQQKLYDTLTKPNATAENINDAYKAITETKDQDGNTVSVKTQVNQVMKQITTNAENQTTNNNLSQAITSKSNSARIYNDQVSTISSRLNQVQQAFSGLSNGIAAIPQYLAQQQQGIEQARSVVYQNAQQINNNQLQTSLGGISKSYDQELTTLQMLASIAQASQV